MKVRLSVLIITKNNEETIEKTIESVKNFDEIIVVDSCSTDKTREKVHKVGTGYYPVRTKVFVKGFDDIGKQRAYGLKYATGDWVLILDSDEIMSKELAREIKVTLRQAQGDKTDREGDKTDREGDKTDREGDKHVMVSLTNHNITAYEIPFQSYFLGRPLRYGGEDYYQIRLIKKDSVDILLSLVHNRFRIKKGKIGKLKGNIHHYSYRSIGQVYRKFTDYAFKTAQIKAEISERSSLKKIFLYPLHMFWSRFIKDKGYKDGLFRIPLDLGFAYMEWLTYCLLAISNVKTQISNLNRKS
ncbi:hypothetical protein CO008_00665 [Candidatus Roizmanbacteria bacterium CG_4_8_14_3_um_filter_36_12]|nr:MAG: hypothetical protein CO008_00665 [Candidatus Roizmanbacteria bacterium CG_4_8_14_3_um_filter_36_12]